MTIFIKTYFVIAEWEWLKVKSYITKSRVLQHTTNIIRKINSKTCLTSRSLTIPRYFVQFQCFVDMIEQFWDAM